MLPIKSQYSTLENFITGSELHFGNNSNLSKAISRDSKVLQTIEYFLQHSGCLKNGDKLSNKLSLYGSQEVAQSNYSHWYSVLTELEAFYILHKTLGLDVCEYERDVQGKKPDFLVNFNNTSVYFEVKGKNSEILQRVPRNVNDLLDKIEAEYNNKYVIAISEVRDKDYKTLTKADTLRLIEKDVKNNLRLCQSGHYPQRKHFSVPTKKDNGEIVRIRISLRQNKNEKRIERFMPDSRDDIKSWLLEEKKKSKKTGKDMTPQVKEAEKKRADYLMCRIPFWQDINEPFYNYIISLFPDIKLLRDNYAISKDSKLGGKLSGIILFREGGSLTDDYIVVSNVNIKPKIKDWTLQRTAKRMSETKDVVKE